MKNLKKILIVLAMLALLITSFAVVIGAEEEEKYLVADLEKLVQSVEGDLGIPGVKPTNTSDKLVEAYNKAFQITEEQKAALSADELALYNSLCEKIATYGLTVAEALYEAIPNLPDIPAADADSATKTAYEKDLDEFIRRLGYTKKHLDAIPVYSSTAAYDAFWAKLDPLNQEVLDRYFAKANPDADLTDPAQLQTAEDAMVLLYKQMQIYATNDADKANKYSKFAYDVARALLDEYNALPGKDLTIDDVTDADIGITDDSTAVDDATKTKMKQEWLRTQYFNRINGIMLIQRFINLADITKAPAYNAFMEDYADAMQRKNDELESKRADLDAKADIVQYDYEYYKDLNFDGEWVKGSYLAYATVSGNNVDDQFNVEQKFETIDGVSTGYQAFLYGDPSISTSGSALHNYVSESYTSATSKEYGIVMEWDMRINEELGGYSLNWMVYDDAVKKGMANLFTIKGGATGYFTIDNKTTNDGQLKLPDDKKVTVENAIPVGVWTHYSLTFNKQTKMGQLYINYEYICDVGYYAKDSGRSERQFRLGPSGRGLANWDGWDVDNYEIYYGNQVRITDKFSKMNDEQKFYYFVYFAALGTGDPENKNITPDPYNYLGRNTAYERAKLLSSKFTGSSHAEINALLNSINYETDIKEKAMQTNLATLQGKVAELSEGLLNTETLKGKETLIQEIKDFVSQNGALINKADTSDTGYQKQMAVVYTMEAEIKTINWIDDFIAAIEKFERATALSALTRHAAAANEVYIAAGFDISANRDLVKDDPLVKKFEQKHNKQLDSDGNSLVEGDEGYLSPDDPSYEKMFDYYDSFTKLIETREKYENSKKIINAVEYITELDGYTDTVEFWAANYAKISDYMNMIRKFINEEKYDVEYDGVDAAVEKFWTIDVYFFERLQKDHIANVEAMLENYKELSTYVEKRAVVESAKDYFKIQDTALNNTKIVKIVKMAVEDEKARLGELQNIVNVYDEEVKALYEQSEDKGAYLDVLEQQTQYFINTINHMDALLNFTDIVRLFEEATTYYYGINLDVEGAVEAAERYAYYRAYIAEVRDNNAMLALYAKELDFAGFEEGAAKRDALYAALKNCREYVDGVDMSDKTVAANVAKYNRELAKYESNVNAVNSAIYQSVQFTNAVRSDSLPITVLSVIGRLINN